jgi:hypothetical protein
MRAVQVYLRKIHCLLDEFNNVIDELDEEDTSEMPLSQVDIQCSVAAQQDVGDNIIPEDSVSAAGGDMVEGGDIAAG